MIRSRADCYVIVSKFFPLALACWTILTTQWMNNLKKKIIAGAKELYAQSLDLSAGHRSGSAAFSQA
jgi:hypothetical protein